MQIVAEFNIPSSQCFFQSMAAGQIGLPGKQYVLIRAEVGSLSVKDIAQILYPHLVENNAKLMQWI